MKSLLKLEDAGKFFLANFAAYQLDYPWWVFYAWLLVPDLSMLGYLVNPKIGAYLYNVIHHQGLAILIFIGGVILDWQGLILAGIVLFGHSAMDRLFGYGLKYTSDFKNTHLGEIGKKATP